MKFLYALSIRLYALAIRLVSLWNPKAKLWVTGRNNWQKRLIETLADKQNIHWFHCASLGEFEQARPLIEKINTEKPNVPILVSFFSPSGYEIRKDYELADYVCYLPLDTKSNARQFISSVDIAKAFFVKYEVWPNFFNELNNQQIPFYLLSATFREDQIYFKSGGVFFKKLLQLPTHIFVQDEASKNVLTDNNIDCLVAGDTRYDRVFEASKKAKTNEIIREFSRSKFTLIAGSSWEKEEDLLAAYLMGNPDKIKVVFAPHDVGESHVSGIEAILKDKITTIRYSQVTNTTNLDSIQVLIIDNIGLLSEAYQYGSIAFVGGGFTNALHNILEPATFGLPVIYGNNHPKFPEGELMKKQGAGFVIKNYIELEKVITNLFENPKELELKSELNKKFISDRIGAKDFIFSQTVES